MSSPTLDLKKKTLRLEIDLRIVRVCARFCLGLALKAHSDLKKKTFKYEIDLCIVCIRARFYHHHDVLEVQIWFFTSVEPEVRVGVVTGQHA